MVSKLFSSGKSQCKCLEMEVLLARSGSSQRLARLGWDAKQEV